MNETEPVTKQQILTTIRRLLEEYFIGSAVFTHLTPETLLSEITADGYFDSLDELELLMALEDEYCIDIPNEAIEALPKPMKVGHYIDLVDERLPKNKESVPALIARSGPSLTELVERFKDIPVPEVSGKVVERKAAAIRVSATLTEEQRQTWHKLGGANWLRKYLAATAKGRSAS